MTPTQRAGVTKPDLILTGICATSVRSTWGRCAGGPGSRPAAGSSRSAPRSFGDVIEDVLRIGGAAGLEDRRAWCWGCDASTRQELVPAFARVRVGFLEWTDPLFVAGHWTPQIIRRARGRAPAQPERGGWRARAADGVAGQSQRRGRQVDRRCRRASSAQHNPSSCSSPRAAEPEAWCGRRLIGQPWFESLSPRCSHDRHVRRSSGWTDEQAVWRAAGAGRRWLRGEMVRAGPPRVSNCVMATRCSTDRPRGWWMQQVRDGRVGPARARTRISGASLLVMGREGRGRARRVRVVVRTALLAGLCFSRTVQFAPHAGGRTMSYLSRSLLLHPPSLTLPSSALLPTAPSHSPNRRVLHRSPPCLANALVRAGPCCCSLPIPRVACRPVAAGQPLCSSPSRDLQPGGTQVGQANAGRDSLGDELPGVPRLSPTRDREPCATWSGLAHGRLPGATALLLPRWSWPTRYTVNAGISAMRLPRADDLRHGGTRCSRTRRRSAVSTPRASSSATSATRWSTRSTGWASALRAIRRSLAGLEGSARALRQLDVRARPGGEPALGAVEPPDAARARRLALPRAT